MLRVVERYTSILPLLTRGDLSLFCFTFFLFDLLNPGVVRGGKGHDIGDTYIPDYSERRTVAMLSVS